MQRVSHPVSCLSLQQCQTRCLSSTMNYWQPACVPGPRTDCRESNNQQLRLMRRSELEAGAQTDRGGSFSVEYL